MTTIHDAITAEFLRRAEESGDIEPVIAQRLKKLLEADRRPKVDDLIKAYTDPVEEDVA